MAKDQSKRIRPAVLREDRDSLAAVKKISAYAPHDPALSTAALTALAANVDAAQEEEAQTEAAAAAARDRATALEWEFHNAIVGMRDQVTGQFRRESDEAQSVGRKKPSERKNSGGGKGQK
ncbi:MAG TPA: hypothetical protein VGC89_03000 [Pyrinomonadaceae bacterium]|jgi:hypothetical protein